MNTYTGPITCSSPCWPHELTQHSCEVSISQQPILIRGSKRGVTSANPYSCHDSHPVFFPIFFFFILRKNIDKWRSTECAQWSRSHGRPLPQGCFWLCSEWVADAWPSGRSKGHLREMDLNLLCSSNPEESASSEMLRDGVPLSLRVHF